MTCAHSFVYTDGRACVLCARMADLYRSSDLAASVGAPAAVTLAGIRRRVRAGDTADTAPYMAVSYSETTGARVERVIPWSLIVERIIR